MSQVSRSYGETAEIATASSTTAPRTWNARGVRAAPRWSLTSPVVTCGAARSAAVFLPDRECHDGDTRGHDQRVFYQAAARLADARHCAFAAGQREVGE